MSAVKPTLIIMAFDKFSIKQWVGSVVLHEKERWGKAAGKSTHQIQGWEANYY